MKIQVLFFGATADAAGERDLEIEVADGAKSEAVFAELLEKFPLLSQHKLLRAVNQEYASGDETLKNGDELALFTAVSGG